MRGLLDFAEVPNGDMLLFNLAYSKEKKPVVYFRPCLKNKGCTKG